VNYWWCVHYFGHGRRALWWPRRTGAHSTALRKPEINAIVVMVGFLGLIEAFVAGIWTGVTRNIPPPFSQIFFQAHGQLFALTIRDIPVRSCNQHHADRRGRIPIHQTRAAVARISTRPRGSSATRRAREPNADHRWMFSAGVGAVAAVIIASGNFGAVPPHMNGIFVAGFIAAVVGGLESPLGASPGACSLD